MGSGRSSSWPPAAAAMFLLLVGFSHCVAAARLLPLQQATAVVLHQENGVTAAATDGLVVQQGEGAAAGNGADELSGISEMMGAEEEVAEEAVACDAEGNDGDECLQRRLLGDAHLDYIYTQHKGKP